MKLKEPLSIEYLAGIVGARVIGDGKALVRGINEIHQVEQGDITFVDHPKYYDFVLKSEASFVLIDQEPEESYGKTLLLTPSPFEAYNALAERFRPFIPSGSAISVSAQIGEGTVIQPNVFVGNYVKIGKNCIIHPNVTIYDHCVIGDNVVIQSNTAIGSDAYYYKRYPDGHYDRMKTIGAVIIENDVEIGSCCTINAGVTIHTTIGRGTKIDSMVHVGHDVVIGKNCLLCAQVGIAGNVTIGDQVTLYGKVGVSKNLHIGSHAVILASSNVGETLEGGKTYFGSPCIEARKMWRVHALMMRLPELWDKVKS